MRIGVIGAGQLGGTLATWCAESGHEVALTSRHPERLREQIDRVNWRLRVMSVPQAASFGEVVIFAPNWSGAKEAVDATRSALSGKVVIDATNPADVASIGSTSAGAPSLDTTLRELSEAGMAGDEALGSGVFGGGVFGGGVFGGGVFGGGVFGGAFSGMAGASTKDLRGVMGSSNGSRSTAAGSAVTADVRGMPDAALVAAALIGPAGEAADMLLARAADRSTRESRANLESRSNLETLIDWAPEAHWVKAFNTIPTDVLSRRRGHDPLLAEFVCTDERDAREAASRLIRDIGFAPFYAGGAKAARLTETGGPLQMREVDVQDATDVLAEALCTLR